MLNLVNLTYNKPCKINIGLSLTFLPSNLSNESLTVLNDLLIILKFIGSICYYYHLHRYIIVLLKITYFHHYYSL